MAVKSGTSHLVFACTLSWSLGSWINSLTFTTGQFRVVDLPAVWPPNGWHCFSGDKSVCHPCLASLSSQSHHIVYYWVKAQSTDSLKLQPMIIFSRYFSWSLYQHTLIRRGLESTEDYGQCTEFQIVSQPRSSHLKYLLCFHINTLLEITCLSNITACRLHSVLHNEHFSLRISQNT